MDQQYTSHGQNLNVINNPQGGVTIAGDQRPQWLYVTLNEQVPLITDWQPREEEKQIVDDLAAGIRLIGITGLGGYGKSTLAAHVFDQADGFNRKLWVSFRTLLSTDETVPFQEFGYWFGQKLGYRPAKSWSEKNLPLKH